MMGRKKQRKIDAAEALRMSAQSHGGTAPCDPPAVDRVWSEDRDKRAANGGWGMCRTGGGRRGACVLGGIGCDIDHVRVRMLLDQLDASASATAIVVPERQISFSEPLGPTNEGSVTTLGAAERGPRRVCLCLIMKNEAAVLPRLIESVAAHIDCFVVCDTGSSDGSQGVLLDEMGRRGIPGDLFNELWVDFGTNRSSLLRHARGVADWLLLLDADWTLEVDGRSLLVELPESPAKWTGLQPQDAFWVEGAQDLKLAHLVVVRGDKPWRATGAVHEYIDCEDGPYTSRLLGGVRWRHHEDGGMRGGDRAHRDEVLLRAQIDAGVQVERGTFYLAQTLRESGRLEEAFDVYQQRIGMSGGNPDEIFYSLYQSAACAAAKGWTRTMELGLLVKAMVMRPERMEALYEIVWRLRSDGFFDASFELMVYAKDRWAAVEAPGSGLFVHSWVWDWGLPFELSIVQYHRGNFASSWRLSEMLLREHRIPEPQLSECKVNQQLALEQLGGEVPLMLTARRSQVCPAELGS